MLLLGASLCSAKPAGEYQTLADRSRDPKAARAMKAVLAKEPRLITEERLRKPLRIYARALEKPPVDEKGRTRLAKARKLIPGWAGVLREKPLRHAFLYLTEKWRLGEGLKPEGDGGAARPTTLPKILEAAQAAIQEGRMDQARTLLEDGWKALVPEETPPSGRCDLVALTSLGDTVEVDSDRFLGAERKRWLERQVVVGKGCGEAPGGLTGRAQGELGWLAQLEEDKQAAEGHLRAALEIFQKQGAPLPRDEILARIRLSLLLEANKPDEALKLLEDGVAALSRYPEGPEAPLLGWLHWARGMLLRAQGKGDPVASFRAAREAYAKVPLAKLDAESTHRWFDSRYRLGMDAMQASRWQEAARTWEELLRDLGTSSSLESELSLFQAVAQGVTLSFPDAGRGDEIPTVLDGALANLDTLPDSEDKRQAWIKITELHKPGEAVSEENPPEESPPEENPPEETPPEETPEEAVDPQEGSEAGDPGESPEVSDPEPADPAPSEEDSGSDMGGDEGSEDFGSGSEAGDSGDEDFGG